MKVTRRQLKNIIKEFLDTSAKPTTQATSTYDQATNSERAAFISAMGIAEKASKKGKVDALQEGTVYSFPGSFGPATEPATEPETQTDLDGDLTPAQLKVYDLGEDPYDDIEARVRDEEAAYAAAFDYDDDYLPQVLRGVSVSRPAGEVLPGEVLPGKVLPGKVLPFSGKRR